MRERWRRVAEVLVGVGLSTLAVLGSAKATEELAGATGGRAGLVSLEPGPPPRHAEGPPEPPIAPLTSVFDGDASLPAHAESVHTTTLRATLDPAAHTIAAE